MSRSKRGGSSKLVLFRVLLLAGSLFVSLVFAEIFLRILTPQPASWLPIYRRHPVLPLYSLQPEAKLHVDTGETNWDIVTDENGFRFNPNLREKTECTALWLGDSYAFGHGVDYEDSFVGIIDSQLEKIDVLNAAVAGYGPTQYRQTLEYLIDQGTRFDFLLVSTYVGNDFHDTKWVKDQAVADGVIGNQNDLKSLLMRNLHLYRLAASIYHRVAPGKESSYLEVVNQLARPEAWNEEFLADARSRFEKEMRRILELGREQGADVEFMILPTRQAVSFARHADQPKVERSNSRPMLPIEKAKEIFDRIGARALDMTPVIAQFPASEMFFQFDGHLTKEGNALVAEAFRRQFPFVCHTVLGAP